MRRKKNSFATTLLVVLFLALIGGVVYLANSPIFERNAPRIEAPESLYWNLREPIKVRLSDDSGIRHYKIVLNDGTSDFTVAEAALETPKKEVTVAVTLPRAGWNRRTAQARMHIETADASRWNMFKGNSAQKDVKIVIDAVRPSAFVLSNSYKITRGGSALVIFSATDDHLKDVAIHTSFGKVFKAEPFYKEGYYAALIAWPVTEKRFRAWVEASDLANNITKAHVPLYLEDYRYRRSNITLKERFLNGKIADLASQFDETANVSDPLERFRIINEDIRAKNEALIHKKSSEISDRLIRRWSVKPFHPLKNAKKSGQFRRPPHLLLQRAQGERIVSSGYRSGQCENGECPCIQPRKSGVCRLQRHLWQYAFDRSRVGTLHALWPLLFADGDRRRHGHAQRSDRQDRKDGTGAG